MKKVISKLHLFMLVVMLMMSFTTTVFASDLDSLNNNDQSTNTSEQSSQQSSTHNDSVTDYLKGYTPVTEENMASASQYASPITNAIGTLTGFIIMIVSAGIFAVTAADLAYIGLPFTRSFLNPEQAQAQGGGMSPMGGGMMGRGMMSGGMMGGGMMGGGAQPQESGMRRRWVSDEAVACVAQANPQQGGGMSPMGGGMMGGGMMGGGMMSGGMMGGGAQQQPAPTKSVIMTYLKKRTFFLVIFSVATILLTSSIFTDCGINLAQLSFKIIDKFNSIISGVQI